MLKQLLQASKELKKANNLQDLDLIIKVGYAETITPGAQETKFQHKTLL